MRGELRRLANEFEEYKIKARHLMSGSAMSGTHSDAGKDTAKATDDELKQSSGNEKRTSDAAAAPRSEASAHATSDARSSLNSLATASALADAGKKGKNLEYSLLVC